MKQSLLLITLVCAFIVTACDVESPGPSADVRQANRTKKAMAEADRQIGMPAIVNFQERRLMKQILELRDQEDLICYAYVVNLNGDLVFLGKCLGYGLPYSVQYTNPERVQKGGSHGGGYWGLAIPQPDPNGLFMPEGLSATWLMLLDKKTGEPRPVYVEPEIVVSPFALHG